MRAAALLASLAAATAGASTLPAGFGETTVFSGLVHPTAVRFASDGRVFVAEKSGLIKVYANLSAPVPTIFADLRTEVDDYWDRGLLGLELHPNFPATPYVYVLYSYDAPIGGQAPTWNDDCPNPPGATTDGCVISGRLSRLTAAGDQMTGVEEVLLEAWGQQFPSHSIGDLHFGPDGALYVSGGEGADFNGVDYGQKGTPLNPLGDPPAGVGGTEAPPNAEGGALRSQSLLRIEGGPALASGAVLRVDENGQPLPDNPLSGWIDPMARRIVAFGLRNPFRFTIRPDTGALWIGDVGWSTWEEINEAPNPTAGVVNFGWPCYEGAAQQPSYAAANLNLCSTLYFSPGAVTNPVYTYRHSNKVVAGESCPTGSSSVSGLAFYGTGAYPLTYDGALFFGDYSRRCIWVMFPDGGGNPDPTNLATFAAGAASPVDLEIGPEGDLFYVDHSGGTVRRVQFFAPTPIATAMPTSGAAPLLVQFDGSGSLPARPGDTLTYAWDLDGDGNFTDSTDPQPSFTYDATGVYSTRLRVTDNHGVASLSDPITITVNNSVPTAFLDAPSGGLAWNVGDMIPFAGHATDPQDGVLPASALTWTVVLHHCPSNCHTHTVQTFSGVASGSFAAPDHEYPSWLELQLTATDSAHLSSTVSVFLYPRTVSLTFQSSPTGLLLVAGTTVGVTPFSRTVIVGSQTEVVAPSPQTSGGVPFTFASWSDGGAADHEVVAGASPATILATYLAADLSLQAAAAPSACVGSAITWTLSTSNAGPTAAIGLSIAAPLPSGASLASWSGDGWSCSGPTNVVCTRARLDPGAAPDVVLTVTAPSVVGDILLAASVSSPTSDPDQSNNGASVTVAVGCDPALASVTPTSGPAAGGNAIAASGQNIEAGADLTIGGVAATGVIVTPPSAISGMAPALLPGTLNDVAARNPEGGTSTLARSYLSDFSDVPAAHLFHAAVEKIFRAAITSGCGGGDFCPADPVTRAQMAIFLLKGEHGSGWTPPPASGTVFIDVGAGDFAAAWIEALAAEGITGGCGGNRFCPNDSVNRASAAVFLLRTKHTRPYTPPPASGIFGDVPVGDPYAAWIEELFHEGITSGCGGGNFCPALTNTRGEMAAFLSRAFSLP